LGRRFTSAGEIFGSTPGRGAWAVIRVFNLRLVAAAKPKKIALIVCM
jgi:hypothetical protein